MDSTVLFRLESEYDKVFSISIRNKPFAILHTHDYYEITLITQGEVQHCVNGQTVTVPSGTAIFLRPQDRHFFNRSGHSEFEYINLPFTQETLQQLLQYVELRPDVLYMLDSPMPPTIRLSATDTQALRRKVDELVSIPNTDTGRKKAYFRLLLADLFFHMLQNDFEPKSYQPLWFNSLLGKLSDPENFTRGVSCLESLSGKSAAYISRIFKENLHITPTQYINDLRLNYCAGQLAHTDVPITTIAMDAGFNNLSHFYHLFREKYKMSPKQYRHANLFVAL